MQQDTHFVQQQSSCLTGGINTARIRPVNFGRSLKRGVKLGRKARIFLTLVVLAAVVGWIVLSYLPETAVALPQIGFSPSAGKVFFPALLISGLAIFLALQLWLVRTTTVAIRLANANEQSESAQRFRLKIGKEFILTALPIGFTLLLAVASYGWWRQLELLR